MGSLKIGELAKQAGIAPSAIRFYESVGLVPKPPRQSGWRKYDPAILERLQVIHAARTIGFSIAEIRMLLIDFPGRAKPSKRWTKLARTKLPELDQIIQRTAALKFLIEAGLSCNCDDIALCINSEGLACRPGTNTPGLVKIEEIA